MSLQKLFRKNSLFLRLFLALWFLSAGLLILTGVFVNRTVEAEFTELVRSSEIAEHEQITESISDILAQEDNFASSLQMSINHLARTHNKRIILEDSNRDVILDTGEDQRRHGPMMDRGMHQGRGPGRDQEHGEKSVTEFYTDREIEENTYPLTINDGEKGRVTILSLDRKDGFFTPEELDFTRQVTRSILAGSGIALLLSALISLIVSLSISKPVNSLKSTAEQLKKGELSQRANVVGPEEIQELSVSFNAMAENLEHTDFIKKKLTQDISHELRNPVSSIKAYLEAFQDGVLEVDEDNLNSTMEELTRLETLSKQLHQLALVDFKEYEPKLDWVNLTDLAYKLKHTISKQVLKYNIEFSCNLPEEEIWIKGDQELLYAAINNLVQNALKFTDNGGLIEMGVEIKDDTNQVMMYVSDNGQGIPQDKLPYIFERFYQVEESRTKKDLPKNDPNYSSCGSGIGLSLVKEWTKAMGGYVVVDSQLGKGSTFKLIFPY
ncbi:sensor histidine kinase [Natranaerobius thermophilus]|uniref:histidine kinase n=1 Tax=Natranaerobius thermophilus (strain ATCC BAA-1301 / DSM 18059 / JW/NM-WN-LF) TaxID=457570 RepID=B2A8D6_NATTJ|nr:HAMP domain-containing sensor histidine kinase [Natranaerobius thermophilus]ACB84502.1 integral membrane sensor signal transduction histidine kinase [Natranaerobius thermophilus JW/NM-WN-LF]